MFEAPRNLEHLNQGRLAVYIELPSFGITSEKKEASGFIRFSDLM